MFVLGNVVDRSTICGPEKNVSMTHHFLRQVEDPEIIDSQFLRINVRHVTDGAGVVVGSILITPKVLMFNPNLSDQLVEESEPDKYQVSPLTPRFLIIYWFHCNSNSSKTYFRFTETDSPNAY